MHLCICNSVRMYEIAHGPHWAVTFLTPLLPPNLVIVDGTVTSVITSNSHASHSLSSCAQGEYLQVIHIYPDNIYHQNVSLYVEVVWVDMKIQPCIGNVKQYVYTKL